LNGIKAGLTALVAPKRNGGACCARRRDSQNFAFTKSFRFSELAIPITKPAKQTKKHHDGTSNIQADIVDPVSRGIGMYVVMRRRKRNWQKLFVEETTSVSG